MYCNCGTIPGSAEAGVWGVIGAGVEGPYNPRGAGVPCECMCESPNIPLEPLLTAGDMSACCIHRDAELCTNVCDDMTSFLVQYNKIYFSSFDDIHYI